MCILLNHFNNLEPIGHITHLSNKSNLKILFVMKHPENIGCSKSANNYLVQIPFFLILAQISIHPSYRCGRELILVECIECSGSVKLHPNWLSRHEQLSMVI